METLQQLQEHLPPLVFRWKVLNNLLPKLLLTLPLSAIRLLRPQVDETAAEIGGCSGDGSGPGGRVSSRPSVEIGLAGMSHNAAIAGPAGGQRLAPHSQALK